MPILNVKMMVNGLPLKFLAGKYFNHKWSFKMTHFQLILSLYRVVFTRKVSNTIKDRQPKLGKYFKPWNNITNGTLNPSDITVSPKSADNDDETFDEFLMNGEIS